MSWQQVPDAAAVASALAAPSSAVPVRVGDAALVLTRDAAGTLRALSNECPHQGATVCRSAEQSADALECPNHYWVFDLAGTFQGSRLALDMGRTAVNVAGQALIPTIVAKRRGLLDQAQYDRAGDIEVIDGAAKAA